MPNPSFNAKLFFTVFLAGIIFLTAGSQSFQSRSAKEAELRLPLGLVSSAELNQLLMTNLKRVLPRVPRVFTAKEEAQINQVYRKTLGINALVELDGHRLNHQWGYMGLEQYLLRYPGDTVADRNFPQAGMAPATGAWSYFASSRADLTPEDIEREKYYLAVQTLYLPFWNQQANKLKVWYQYRKVLVTNPLNGATVVAVVADAGPAKWTGKQFGGSPQVMSELGLYPKRTKARVLVLFVDDPNNQIPLGLVTKPFF